VATVTWCRGTPSGLDCGKPFVPKTRGSVSKVVAVGDVDGDGKGDVLVRTWRLGIRDSMGDVTDAVFESLFLHLGTKDGPAPEPLQELTWYSFWRRATPRATPLGDVDGDGFADVGLEGPDGATLARGSPEGLVHGAQQQANTMRLKLWLEDNMTSLFEWRPTSIRGTPGDIDGDGQSDLVVQWNTVGGALAAHVGRHQLPHACGTLVQPLRF
jgi:hypothetical protein